MVGRIKLPLTGEVDGTSFGGINQGVGFECAEFEMENGGGWGDP